MTTRPTPPDSDEVAIRAARRRSYLLPGGGFAYLGHPVIGGIGIGLGVLALYELVSFLQEFTPDDGFLVLTSCAVVACFSLLEYFVLSLGVVSVRDAGPVRRLILPTGIAFTTVLCTALAACLMSIGSVKMAGNGMSPTVHIGEQLVYQKRVFPEDLRPRHLILFRLSPQTSWGRPGEVTLSRILAVPGDRVSIQGRQYAVNGQPADMVGTTQGANPVVKVPRSPESLTVPDGCYFVIQDDDQAGYDSQVLSFVRAQDVVATRVFLLSGRDPDKRTTD